MPFLPIYRWERHFLFPETDRDRCIFLKVEKSISLPLFFTHFIKNITGCLCIIEVRYRYRKDDEHGEPGTSH